jgi:hypothetical protein
MLNSLRQRLSDLNVFTSEDQEHRNSNDERQQTTSDPDSRLLREQQISTRIYIILLAGLYNVINPSIFYLDYYYYFSCFVDSNNVHITKLANESDYYLRSVA